MIAALYIDERGPYVGRDGVDAWGVSRDARNYAGPHPVVAHPPCGPWSTMRHLYEGSERDCALVAVQQVRAHGGVLEHPARSALWRAAALPLPGELPDALGGWTIEVCQCDFGHVARKRTWLYVVGSSAKAIRLPPPREPTHWASGSRGKSSRQGKPVPPGIKVCSAQQRRRTPPAFADFLISIAESCR